MANGSLVFVGHIVTRNKEVLNSSLQLVSYDSEVLHGVRSISECTKKWLWAASSARKCSGMATILKKIGVASNSTWSLCSLARSNHSKKPRNAATCLSGLDKKGEISSNLSEEDKSKLQTYYDRFEAHVSPRANPVFARFKFYGRVQGSAKTAEKFTTDLRILPQDCDFKDPDEIIRDRIVFGTNCNSPKVREKLISKGSALSLDKAVEIARSFEAS